MPEFKEATFTEAYRSIFESMTGKENQCRLYFLQTVAKGTSPIQGQDVTLEKMAHTMNQEKPLADETKTARAMLALRRWYEKPEPENERHAKIYVQKAGLGEITAWFDNCLAVLKVYKMRNAFDAAINYAKNLSTEQEKADMVHLAASSLRHSGIAALRDYVVEKMPTYAKKYRFNEQTWKAELAESELQHAHK